MINQTTEFLSKLLRFYDMKIEEQFHEYFEIDVKKKYRIFIYIECIYSIAFIINDILKYAYSNDEYLTKPLWLFINIFCIFGVFCIFFTLSILVIKNKLTSINSIDFIIFIIAIIIQFLFNNPLVANSNDNQCIDRGYQAYWEGYGVQFHTIIMCNLFNKWLYKFLYFGTTSVYFYFYKNRIIDDQIIGVKILGFIIAYGIMMYYHEREYRLNYMEFHKLLQKEKMWKDIIDSLSEGVLVVNKNSKPLYINNIIENYSNKLKINEDLKHGQNQKDQPQDNYKNYDNKLENFFDKVTNLKLRNSLDDLKVRYKKLMSVNKKPNGTESSFEIKNIPDLAIDQEINKYHPLIEGLTLNELMKFTFQIEDSQHIFSMDDFISFDSIFEEKSLEIKVKYIHLDGELVLLIIFIDTTHRDLIAKLEQNDKYKNIVLSTVSHELRTPLNSAISMLQTAIDTNNISQIHNNELLYLSLRSLNMLASLINDILDYSQIQANKLNLVFQNVDLRQVIYDACALFKIQCKKKGIELIIDIFEEVPNFIRTDPNRLTQIILNLLSNAIKFTKKGHVKISVKWDYSKYGNATISVEDTGIGIKPEEISKLFQDFGKIDLGENAKMNPTGCGLGLSISHKLAIRLGRGDSGGIKVQSEVDKGSTFSFNIEDKQDKKKILLNTESILNLNIRPDNPDIQPFSLTKPSKISSLLSLKQVENGNSSFMTLSKKIQRKTLSKALIGQYINSQVELDEGNRKDILNNKPMKLMKLYDIMEDKTPCQTLNKSFIFDNTERIPCSNCDKIFGNKPKLLIIDDDTVNLYAITLITKYLDYECDTAHSVEEGFKLLQKENLCKLHPPYDIIFMDFNMPDINGLTATGIIKDMILQKKLPSISIVGCTAFLNEEIKEKGIESGMDYIMEKPITKEKLFRIVNMFKKDI